MMRRAGGCRAAGFRSTCVRIDALSVPTVSLCVLNQKSPGNPLKSRDLARRFPSRPAKIFVA